MPEDGTNAEFIKAVLYFRHPITEPTRVVKICPNRLGPKKIAQAKPHQLALAIGSICAGILLCVTVGCHPGQSPRVMRQGTHRLDLNPNCKPSYPSNSLT